MEKSAKNSLYSIEINKKKYTFHCSDGQEHVNELQSIVSKIIDSLSSRNLLVSDQTVKMALLLADENVREKRAYEKRLRQIEAKAQSLINELDKTLIFVSSEL